jgi:tetratricopeptide (TPR) repeat protein
MMKVRARALGWPLLGLLGVLPACAVGAEATPPARPAPPAKQQLSPDEQAAHDILERYKADAKIKQGESRQLAEQHFRTGKAHFDMGAWRAAYEHFQKAVALDPTHKEAQEYLQKTRGLLGIKEGGAGLVDSMVAQEKVRREAQRIELLSLFEQAKAAYARGQFAEALELFIRVKAKAQFLAPHLDTSEVTEEAEQGIQRTKAAIDRQRSEGEQEQRRRAAEEAERLRKEGRSLLVERHEAQLAQALSLFGAHRYGQARKLCDQVLRHDPSNGSAAALREGALQAARAEGIAQAINSRASETNLLMQQLTAMTVPQNRIISISRQRIEELRNRKGDPLFESSHKPPEEWEMRIREALEKKVTFDFIETPLPDVLSFLGSLTGVTLVLDTEAVKGASPNVTLRVQEMRLEAALNWLCKLAGLGYTLRDEAVFISRPERIHDTPVLRMYDITDLTIGIKNFKGRQRALATDTGFGAQQNVRDFFEDDEEEDESEKPLSGAEMVEFLKRIARPTGPEDDGGLERVQEVLGLPRDQRPGKAQELVDLIGVTIGGRSYIGVKTRE